MVSKTNSYWIGSPLTKNKPHNFFKTSKKNIPSYMFRDNDRDGVANVFDCKPNDPFKQGFVDAVLSAGKAVFTKGASVKKSWREGMSSTKSSRNFEKRANQFEKEKQAERSRAEQIKKMLAKPSVQVPTQRRGWTPPQEKEFETTGRLSKREFRKQKELEYLNKEMAKRVENQYDIENLLTAQRWKAKAESYGNKGGKAVIRMMQRHNPSYSPALEYKKRRIAEINEAITKARTSGQKTKLKRQLEKVQFRMDKVQFRMDKQLDERSARKLKSMHRAVEMVFPVTYLASYGSSSGGKTISGIPGRGRGRPTGSLDRRYAPYGGVMGYRKYVSAQKKAMRIQFQQQQQTLKMNKIKRMSQYEQIQQARQLEQGVQVPQEIQGAAQDYSQYQELQGQQPPQQQQQQQQQQEPQQYSQPQQYQQQYEPQYPQQQYQPQYSEKKPIATVFKGSGGHPYPPVDRRPLTPSRQTIQQGYIETVDSFSGKRIIKKLPASEKWATGG